MSRERLYRTLVGFGLTRTDAKVYIYLAKKGPRKGKDLCHSLNMQKQQLYLSLKNLQSKGIVTTTCKRPVLFFALPFEKVLDLRIKANIEKARKTRQDKEKLLSIWQFMIREDATK